MTDTTEPLGFPAVTSAMGWSGTYAHCPCCDDGCKMRHYAPCVDDRHAEESI